MVLDQFVEVDGAQNAAVHEDDVLFLGILQEAHGGAQRLQLAAIARVVIRRVRRQELEAALFQVQVPLLAGADMVHQGLVVVLRDDADMTDAGIGHIGQGKVDLTVAAAVGQ